MELVLQPSDFVNDKYTVTFGEGKEALFTIVDEPLLGINRITILVRNLLPDGSPGAANLQSSIIGFGNNTIGAKSSIPELRGKLLNKDNMADVTVVLYED